MSGKLGKIEAENLRLIIVFEGDMKKQQLHTSVRFYKFVFTVNKRQGRAIVYVHFYSLPSLKPYQTCPKSSPQTCAERESEEGNIDEGCENGTFRALLEKALMVSPHPKAR
jgi:hypothetical protein